MAGRNRSLLNVTRLVPATVFQTTEILRLFAVLTSRPRCRRCVFQCPLVSSSVFQDLRGRVFAARSSLSGLRGRVLPIPTKKLFIPAKISEGFVERRSIDRRTERSTERSPEKERRQLGFTMTRRRGRFASWHTQQTSTPVASAQPSPHGAAGTSPRAAAGSRVAPKTFDPVKDTNSMRVVHVRADPSPGGGSQGVASRRSHPRRSSLA